MSHHHRMVWAAAVVSVLSAAASGQGGQFELTVVQYQHPVVDNQEAYAKQVADAVELARSHGQGNVLLLNTGGTMRALRRQLRIPGVEPAATAFSKEDFNGGVSSLMARIVGSPETFVVSNMKSPLLRRFVSESVVVDIGGKSVGVVGYVSRYLNQKLQDAGSMPIVAEVPALQREVSRLKERGVDIVIALGGAGHRRNSEIARSVRGLDAVVAAPVESRSAASETFPQAVRQPWGTVIPLLEIPVLNEHMIGITRLQFDETNQVTQGVGMFTVADGTNPEAVEQKQLALLEMNTIDGSGEVPPEAVETLSVAASEYYEQQVVADTGSSPSASSSASPSASPPASSIVVSTEEVESADGSGDSEDVDELFDAANQAFIPPFTLSASEDSQVVKNDEKGPLSSDEVLALKQQHKKETEKEEEGDAEQIKEEGDAEQVKEEVSQNGAEGTVVTNVDIAAGGETVEEIQKESSGAVEESSDQTVETLTAAEIQDLKSDHRPLTAAQVEALKNRFVVAEGQQNYPGPAVLVDKSTVNTAQGVSETVTHIASSTSTDNEVTSSVNNVNTETSATFDSTTTPLVHEENEEINAAMPLVMQDKNAEVGVPSTPTVLATVQLDETSTNNNVKEDIETIEHIAQMAEKETFESNADESSLVGVSDEAPGQESNLELEGSGVEEETEAGNEETESSFVETTSETMVLPEQSIVVQSDENTSADSTLDTSDSIGISQVNEDKSGNTAAEQQPSSSMPTASELADSIQDEAVVTDVGAENNVLVSDDNASQETLATSDATDLGVSEAGQLVNVVQESVELSNVDASSADDAQTVSAEHSGEEVNEVGNAENELAGATIAVGDGQEDVESVSEEATDVSAPAQDVASTQTTDEEPINEAVNIDDVSQDISSDSPGEAITSTTGAAQEQVADAMQDGAPSPVASSHATDEEPINEAVNTDANAMDVSEDISSDSSGEAVVSTIGVAQEQVADADPNIEAAPEDQPETPIVVEDSPQDIVADSSPDQASTATADASDLQQSMEQTVGAETDIEYPVQAYDEQVLSPQFIDASLMNGQDPYRIGSVAGVLDAIQAIVGEKRDKLPSDPVSVSEADESHSSDEAQPSIPTAVEDANSETKTGVSADIAPLDADQVKPEPEMDSGSELAAPTVDGAEASVQSGSTADDEGDNVVPSSSAAEVTSPAAATILIDSEKLNKLKEEYLSDLSQDQTKETENPSSEPSDEEQLAQLQALYGASSGSDNNVDSEAQPPHANSELGVLQGIPGVESGSDPEDAEVSSVSESAEVKPNSESDDMNSNSEAAGVSSDPEATEVSSESETVAEVGSDSKTAEVSSESDDAKVRPDSEDDEVESDSDAAEVSPDSETAAEVSSDSENAAEVSSDSETAVEASSDSETAEVSSDPEATEVSSESETVAEVGSDSKTAEMSSESDDAKVNPDSEDAEVESDSDAAEVSPDSETAAEVSSDSENAAEVSSDPEAAEVSSESEIASEVSSDSVDADVSSGSEDAQAGTNPETAEVEFDSEDAEVSSDSETAAEVSSDSETAEVSSESDDDKVNPDSEDAELSSGYDAAEVSPDSETASKVSSDSENAAEASSDSETAAEVSSDSEAAEVSADSEAAAEVKPDSEAAEVSSDSGAAEVSSDSASPEVISDSQTPAEVSSDSETAEAISDSEAAEISSDPEATEVSSESETVAEVGSDTAAPEVISDSETPADVSSESETAEANSDSEADEISSDSETAEVSSGSETAEVSSDSEIQPSIPTAVDDADSETKTDVSADIAPLDADQVKPEPEMDSGSELAAPTVDGAEASVQSGSTADDEGDNVVPSSSAAEVTSPAAATILIDFEKLNKLKEEYLSDLSQDQTKETEKPSSGPSDEEQLAQLQALYGALSGSDNDVGSEAQPPHANSELGVAQASPGVEFGSDPEGAEVSSVSETADSETDKFSTVVATEENVYPGLEEPVQTSDSTGANPETETVENTLTESAAPANGLFWYPNTQSAQEADSLASLGPLSAMLQSGVAVEKESAPSQHGYLPSPQPDDQDIDTEGILQSIRDNMPAGVAPGAVSSQQLVTASQTAEVTSEIAEGSSEITEGNSEIAEVSSEPEVNSETGASSENGESAVSGVTSETSDVAPASEISGAENAKANPGAETVLPVVEEQHTTSAVESEIQDPGQSEPSSPGQPEVPSPVHAQELSPVQSEEPSSAQTEAPSSVQITSASQGEQAQSAYGQPQLPAQNTADVITTIQDIVTQQQEEQPDVGTPSVTESEANGAAGGPESGVDDVGHEILKEEGTDQVENSGVSVPAGEGKIQTEETGSSNESETSELEGASPSEIAEPEDPSETDTAEPEGLSETETAEPEGLSETETAEPETPSETDTTEPEGPPKTETKPEGLSESETVEPEAPSDTEVPEPEILTGNGIVEPESPSGSEVAEAVDPSANEIAEPEESSGNVIAEPEVPLGNEIAQPEGTSETDVVQPEGSSGAELAEPEDPSRLGPADQPQTLPPSPDSQIVYAPNSPPVVPSDSQPATGSGPAPALPNQHPLLPALPAHVTEDELLTLLSHNQLSPLGLSQSQLLALLAGQVPQVTGQESFVPVRAPGATDPVIVSPVAGVVQPISAVPVTGSTTGTASGFATSAVSTTSTGTSGVLSPVSGQLSSSRPGAGVRPPNGSAGGRPPLQSAQTGLSSAGRPSAGRPSAGAPSAGAQPAREDPVLAVTTGTISGEAAACLGTECGMGKIIADALRWKLRAEVEGTFVASDVFEGTWNGEIRRSDIAAIVRNNPQISIVTIEGANFGDFIHALEQSPLFYHMSGVRLIVSSEMEISVSVLCEGCGTTPYQPINTAKPYVLAFLTGADDRLFSSPVFADVRPLTLDLVDDVLVPYVQSTRFVSAPTDDRIVLAGGAAPSQQFAQNPAQLLTEDERLEALKQQYLSDILAVAAEAEGGETPSNPQELLQKLTELQQQYQQAAPGAVAAVGTEELDQLALLQQEYTQGGVAGVAPVRLGALAPVVQPAGVVRPVSVQQTLAVQSPTVGLTDTQRLALLQQQYAQTAPAAAPAVAPVRAGPEAPAPAPAPVVTSSASQPSTSQPTTDVQTQPVFIPADESEPPTNELTRLQELFALQQQYGTPGTAPDPTSASVVGAEQFSAPAPGSEDTGPFQQSAPQPSSPQSGEPQSAFPQSTFVQSAFPQSGLTPEQQAQLSALSTVQFAAAPEPQFSSFPSHQVVTSPVIQHPPIQVALASPDDPEFSQVQQQALAAYQQAANDGGAQLAHVLQLQTQTAHVVPSVHHIVRPVHAQAVAQAVQAPASQLVFSVGSADQADAASAQEAALVAYQQQFQQQFQQPVQQQYLQQVQSLLAVPHQLQQTQDPGVTASVLDPVEAQPVQQAALAAYQLVHSQSTTERPSILVAVPQPTTEEASNTPSLAQTLLMLKTLPAKVVLGLPVVLLMASLTAGAFI